MHLDYTQKPQKAQTRCLRAFDPLSRSTCKEEHRGNPSAPWLYVSMLSPPWTFEFLWVLMRLDCQTCLELKSFEDHLNCLFCSFRLLASSDRPRKASKPGFEWFKTEK